MKTFDEITADLSSGNPSREAITREYLAGRDEMRHLNAFLLVFREGTLRSNRLAGCFSGEPVVST